MINTSTNDNSDHVVCMGTRYQNIADHQYCIVIGVLDTVYAIHRYRISDN